MLFVVKIILDKKFIIQICNIDNKCFVCVVFVCLVNSCKIYNIEFNKVKVCYLFLICGEILLFYQQCLFWYYKDLCKNKKGF